MLLNQDIEIIKIFVFVFSILFYKTIETNYCKNVILQIVGRIKKHKNVHSLSLTSTY